MMRARASGMPGLSVRATGDHDMHRALPEEVAVALVYNGTTQAVMMATPDDLIDFGVGFSLTEGIITDPAQIDRIEVVTHAAGVEVQMWLAEDRAAPLAARRRHMMGPVGCGLCGIDSLDQALRPLPQVVSDLRLRAGEVDAAVQGLTAHQPLHDQTRAVHAAAFYVPGQGLVLTCEDVGRHNALDKLVGGLAHCGIAARTGAIVITSRVSVDIVQKCAVAGAPVLIAVSAPTAQAVRSADAARLTLIGLARGHGFDIFTHPHRIVREAPDAG